MVRYRAPVSDDALDGFLHLVDEHHRPTIEVLVQVLRTGRQLEAWLSDTLTVEGLDPSGFSALAALWLQGPPHRLGAGEIADGIVQTTGGTTKTIRRLETSGFVHRVADPDDGRRALIELTPAGIEAAKSSLELVLDAFDLDIGDLDAAELGGRMARLSSELGERLQRR